MCIVSMSIVRGLCLNICQCKADLCWLGTALPPKVELQFPVRRGDESVGCNQEIKP